MVCHYFYVPLFIRVRYSLTLAGTVSRITNWATMTHAEQQTAWQRIAERNKARRDVLLEREKQETQAQNNAGE